MIKTNFALCFERKILFSLFFIHSCLLFEKIFPCIKTTTSKPSEPQNIKSNLNEKERIAIFDKNAGEYDRKMFWEEFPYIWWQRRQLLSKAKGIFVCVL